MTKIKKKMGPEREFSSRVGSILKVYLKKRRFMYTYGHGLKVKSCLFDFCKKKDIHRGNPEVHKILKYVFKEVV